MEELVEHARRALQTETQVLVKREDEQAFAARPDALDAWRAHLQEHGVAIEMEVNWEQGGTSIYFRDPAGNSLELAPTTLWGGGWEF